MAVKSPEYDTLFELQDVLKIGIKDDIDSVISKAFSARLITDGKLEELDELTPSKKTASFLRVVLNKIEQNTANLKVFKGTLDPFVHEELVKRIDETLKGKKKSKQSPADLDMPDTGSTEEKSVFISYKWEEEVKPFVDKLAIALARQGVTVWKDDKVVRTGDKLNECIVEGINNCKVFVPILSEKYLSEEGEKWCQRELIFAKEKKKEMVPICWGKTKVPDLFQFIIGPSILRGSYNPEEVDADDYIEEICPVIKEKVQSVLSSN